MENSESIIVIAGSVMIVNVSNVNRLIYLRYSLPNDHL